jgi:hypothetical protein
MHAPLVSDHPLIALQRLQERHRANVEECAPLLDHSIPLGTVLMSAADTRATRKYYADKIKRTGSAGRYFLHQTGSWKGTMHDLRRGVGRDG